MNTAMLSNKPAKPSRVRCASWVCSFEFKMLRLIRVLSAQIAAAVTTACIDAHNIFALVIQFLTSFHTIYIILLTFLTVFGKLQTVVWQISPTLSAGTANSLISITIRSCTHTIVNLQTIIYPKPNPNQKNLKFGPRITDSNTSRNYSYKGRLSTALVLGIVILDSALCLTHLKASH